MKISYVSDLHLDFHVKYGKNEKKMERLTIKFIEDLIATDEGERDVLVIAGDISHYNKQSIIALEVFNRHYKLVIFVPGNHDYYLVSGMQSRKYFNDSINRMAELFSSILYSPSLDNVYMLDNDIITYKGLKFYGSTMWYNLDTVDQQRFYTSCSNDSVLIKGMNHYDLHESDVEEYEIIMECCKPDIVVTHVPLIDVDTHIKYGSNHCYKCNVEQLAPITISGHVHEQKEYCVDGNKVLFNAIGYGDEKNKLEIKSVEV